MGAIYRLNYFDVRHKIRDGDLLFWEPTNWPGKIIARGTGGRFSHVASVSWAGDVLETHEMLQFYGGRTVNLSSQVRRYPGKIHVYRVPALDGHAFSQLQRRRAGEQYGWRDLSCQAFRCVGGDTLRYRLSELYRDEEPERWEETYRTPICMSAFCSEAVVSDIRHTGLDVLPTLGAWEVSPNQLATVAEYLFTLEK